jgi:hypothetical protein
MYDFFKENSGKIAVTLAVVTVFLVVVAFALISSVAATTVMYIAGFTGCGSVLSSVFNLAYSAGVVDELKLNYDASHYKEVQEQGYEEDMVPGNRSTPQLINGDEVISEHEQPAQDDLSKAPQKNYVSVTDFLGVFFRASNTQKTKSNRLSDRAEAIKRCREQVDIELSEIDAITELMHQYNGELASFLESLPSQTQEVTEEIPLGVSIKKDISARGASELRELINTYPKYSCETAVTVESVEAYAKASSEHHCKVIAVATDLFPDFYALLNEAKDRVATLQNINPS